MKEMDEVCMAVPPFVQKPEKGRMTGQSGKPTRIAEPGQQGQIEIEIGIAPASPAATSRPVRRPDAGRPRPLPFGFTP